MLLRDYAVLALKKETTEGTLVALTAAEATLLVFDLAYKPSAEFTVRNPSANTLSHRQSVRGKAFGEISFKFELKGEDSTVDSVPSWGPLLEAAGLKQTVTGATSVKWEPYDDLNDFTIVPSLSIATYVDGVKRVLRGARPSSMKLDGPVAGVITCTMTVKGVMDQEADVAILAPTYPTAVPEVLGVGVFTLDALNYTGTMFGIEMGLKTAERFDPQLEFGCKSVAATNHELKITMDPEQELVATRSFLNEYLANTITDVKIQVGTGIAGHEVTIDANRCQWEGADEGNRDGLSTVGLNGRILGPEAGGVELTITKK